MVIFFIIIQRTTLKKFIFLVKGSEIMGKKNFPINYKKYDVLEKCISDLIKEKS